jgi:hypothetical protein
MLELLRKQQETIQMLVARQMERWTDALINEWNYQSI